MTEWIARKALDACGGCTKMCSGNCTICVRGRRVKPASREAYADSGEDLEQSTRPLLPLGRRGHAQHLQRIAFGKKASQQNCLYIKVLIVGLIASIKFSFEGIIP
jgi:hypothetical protein